MSCSSKVERRREVAQLKKEGRSVKEIARELKLPLAKVGNALQKERRRPEPEAQRPAASPPPPPPPPPPAGSGGSGPREMDWQTCPHTGRRGVTRDEMRSDVEQDLADLRKIEQAAWGQWEVSCLARNTVSKRFRRSAGGDPGEDGEVCTASRRDAVGDARFLNIALRCINQRQKLRHTIELLFQ